LNRPGEGTSRKERKTQKGERSWFITETRSLWNQKERVRKGIRGELYRHVDQVEAEFTGQGAVRGLKKESAGSFLEPGCSVETGKRRSGDPVRDSKGKKKETKTNQAKRTLNSAMMERRTLGRSGSRGFRGF